MLKLRNSLATRAVMAVTILTALSVLLTIYVAPRFYAYNLEKAAFSEQEILAEQLAARMDQDIRQAQKALIDEGDAITARQLSNSESMQWYLRTRQALRSFFDYGLLFIDIDGQLIATSPELADAGLETQNFALVDYFQKTIATNQPQIADPYISASVGFSPVVAFTTPVHGTDGELAGVFVGGMNLLHDNILSRPRDMRIGKAGYVAVFTRQGIVVSHTDPEQLMANFADRYFFGQQSDPLTGTMLTSDYRNQEMLTTARRLKSTQDNWVLAISKPLAEVTAPLGQAQLFLVFCFTPLAIFFAYIVARILTARLERLTQYVAELNRHPAQTLDVSQFVGSDEIGIHARAMQDLLDTLEERRQEIASLTREAESIEAREKRKLAQDLHDSVCQSLAFANLQLGQLANKASPELLPKLEQVRKVIEDSVAELRSLLVNLSPPILSDLGLSAAVEWWADKFATEQNLSIKVVGQVETELSFELANFFYRVNRELLANVVRHAQATQVVISLQDENQLLSLTVEDNGQGLNKDIKAIFSDCKNVDKIINKKDDRSDGKKTGVTQSTINNTRQPSGFGLRSLRERARLLGGKMTVSTSEKLGGVAVSISIPYEE